jgi:hypothetical protein
MPSSNQRPLRIRTPGQRSRLRAALLPNAIRISFTNAVPDDATVNLGDSVRIMRGPDDVRGTISWPLGNEMLFTADDNLAPGEYSIVLHGDGPSPIMALPGAVPAHALDGEPTAAWPTGDGTPGGDYTLGFEVV